MKKTFLLIVSVLLTITCLTSCGEKKPFDDELVIAYFNEVYPERFSSNEPTEEAVNFYIQYGLKYKKNKYGAYELNGKQNGVSVSEFVSKTVNDPNFYERNDSKTELWENYYTYIENLPELFASTGHTGPFKACFGYKSSEDFSTFFGKTFTTLEEHPYYEVYKALTPLEAKRLNISKPEELSNALKDISNIIAERFISLCKQKKYEAAATTPRHSDASRIINYLNDGDNEYVDNLFNDYEYKDYFPCDFYYYLGELPDKTDDYGIYKYAVNYLHDVMNHENCSSLQVMSDRLDLMNIINSTDWKLYYLSGEYITDMDIFDSSYIRMLEFEKDSSKVIYNLTNGTELEGYMYYKGNELYITIDDYDINGGARHRYDGKLTLTKGDDGKLELQWKGSAYYQKGWDGYSYFLDCRFTN